MEIDIGARNVPFHVDNSIFLTDRDLKNWKKVPWAFYSGDKRPEERKEKITSLGRLRFLEGWLYDNLSEPGTIQKEQYWSQEFDTWFKDLRKEGIITDTRECEGCIGSFWKLASEDDLYNAFPGHWVYEGRWWRVYDSSNCRQTGAPPSFCQISQLDYNRRLTIQMKAWGAEDEVEIENLFPEKISQPRIQKIGIETG